MSLDTLVARFWAKVDQSAGPDGCHPWRGAYSQKRHYPPRPVIWVMDLPEGGQLIVPAFRLALSIADGVPLHDRTGLYACHVPFCANPSCVNARHGYWGTEEENRWDRYGQPRDAIRWMERLR